MISHGVKNFVAIKGTPGDSNSQERFKGFQEAVNAHAGEGVKLLQELGGLQTEDNGYSTMQNLLSAHPSGTIDGVSATTTPYASGPTGPSSRPAGTMKSSSVRPTSILRPWI